MMKLKHESDMPISKPDPCIIPGGRNIRVADQDRACVNAIESTDHLQQSALAHTGRTNYRNHLPPLDSKVEPAQHNQLSGTHGIHLGEPLNRDKGHCDAYWYLNASAGSRREACRDAGIVASRHMRNAAVATRTISSGPIRNGTQEIGYTSPGI